MLMTSKETAIPMIFLSKPERLKRKALQSGQSYSQRARIINELHQLPDSAERTQALRAIALSKLPASEIAVEALASLPHKDTRIRALCEVAESGEHDGARKAIELLGHEPVSDTIVDCLCRLVRSIVTYQNVFYSTSPAGFAAQALRRNDYKMQNPKFRAALLEALCHGKWEQDYDSPSNWAFKQLKHCDQNDLDNVIIPELVRMAKETPLGYRNGGRLSQNRYVHFLDELKKNSPSTAEKALEKIEHDTFSRRVKAIPEVLERTSTEQYYDSVEELIYELNDLANKGVTEAVNALAEFRKRPARTLPERTWKSTEVYDALDGGYFTHGSLEVIGMKSTSELGQE